jgi:putative aldouronate transport system permease protein
MLIMFLSPSDGFINRIIVFFGGSPIHFMARAEWFRPLFISVNIWSGLGWGAIIYIAALAGVNPELYESAVLDGAGRIKMMRHISIPSIAPTIIILFLLNVGTIMSLGHEQVLLMQNPLNMETSEVISTFVFRRGLLFNDFSFAQAVSVFNNVINITILVAANQISRRVSDTSLW